MSYSFHCYLVFLIFFSCSKRAIEFCRGSISISSHISFYMIMTFVRYNYLGQFANPVSFCYCELLEEVFSILLSAMFTVFSGINCGNIVGIAN